MILQAMMKIALALLSLGIGLPVASALAAEPAKERPNIVFILADDYGLDGVGCYGSDRFKGKTPNIDSLASGGLRFTQCYSMPLCGPTRCALMTGRYGFRTGGSTNQTAGQPSFQNEPSIARTLKQAGYATAMAGKWRQMSDTPGDWGFDEWLTDPTAGGWYWKNSYTKNGQTVESANEIYGPDACMDFARDFLKRQGDRPFFLYYPTHLVHGPILRTPDSRSADREQLYEDNVAYLDKQVGQLVSEIDRLGLRQRTVIVFCADNGTARFGAEQSIINGRKINGQKGTMQEGGARVPLIANWRGTTPEGKVSDDLVDITDFFSTFAAVAGAQLPKEVTLDSHSFASALRGDKGDPRKWIFVQLGARWYVREPAFKLTENGELLDMADAPHTEKPVSPDSASREAQAARTRLQAVLDQLNPAAGKNSTQPAIKAQPAKKKKRQAKKNAA